MSPRLTAAITVAIHELKRRPYSTIRNDTVAELEAALAAEPHEMPDANKVDAERYRWLRDRSGCVNIAYDDGKFQLPDYQDLLFCWRRREWVDGKPVVVCDGLDAAVDKARA